MLPGVRAYIIQCRVCGFDPEDQSGFPKGRCPKCNADAWERLYKPGYYLNVLGFHGPAKHLLGWVWSPPKKPGKNHQELTPL